MHIKQVAQFVILSVTVAALATVAVAMDQKLVKEDGLDLTKARALIKKENWPVAISELRRLERQGGNADVYNLLGFSFRKMGKYDDLFIYYQRALKLAPKHLAAHEYLGELYILTGAVDKARKQATVLAKLCPKGCKERATLDQALAAVKK